MIRKTLKEVEKSEINFAFKNTDYIQQQINAKAGDWITNGVFKKIIFYGFICFN